MDFEFSEEQKMFREAIRDFATKEVAPIVDEAAKAPQSGLLMLPPRTVYCTGDLESIGKLRA